MTIMGNVLSDWLDSDGFQQATFLNAAEHEEFYTAIKRAVSQLDAAVEGSRQDGDVMLTHAQQLLDDWGREADVLYDWRSDVACVLHLTAEPDAAHFERPPVPSAAPGSPTPVMSAAELMLRAACISTTATSDQIFHAIKQLEMSVSPDIFARVLAKYPRALRLYLAQLLYGHLNADESLRLLGDARDHARSAHLIGVLAYGDATHETLVTRLQAMVKCLALSQATDRAGPSPRAMDAFATEMTRVQLTLLEQQRQLETMLPNDHFVGLSLIETVHKLLALYPARRQALALAIQLSAKNVVHPRQLWWALLRVFSQTGQWQTIFILAAATRPPIGYTAIVDVFLEDDRPDKAQELIALIKDPEEHQAVVERMMRYERAREAEQTDTSEVGTLVAPLPTSMQASNDGNSATAFRTTSMRRASQVRRLSTSITGARTSTESYF